MYLCMQAPACKLSPKLCPIGNPRLAPPHYDVESISISKLDFEDDMAA